jgi:hypothetical protein
MEQIKEYVPVAQMVSTLIAASSVLIAAIGLFRTARANRRQTNAQIFLDCVKRYEKIVESFPLEAWLLRFDPIQIPPESPETTQAALRYLNLCSEEFYLKRQKYFSEQIWEIWDDLLKRTFRSALFKREWELLKSEFASDPDFTAYVEKAQRYEVADTERAVLPEVQSHEPGKAC